MEEKRIKVVFLCRDFGKVNRGVEAHVEELSKRLIPKFEVQILSGKDADDLGKVLKGKFDLVIPTNGRAQAFKMSMGRFLGGFKVLIAAHAGRGRDEIWNLLMRPDVYVALTETHLNWAKQFAFGIKLEKIPNGIDLEKFQQQGGKMNFGLERPVILSVGALEWYKYHDLAIKAVSKLEKGSLLIVGKGSEKEELKNLGRDLLGVNRFRIIEAEYEKMPEIYRSVDLFTLPSWDREAFGIVYLEAMASGLAVVAPNDLSRKEIIGNAGILVDVFDTNKYAGALKNASDKKWGRIPREQAEKFSWEKVTKQYEGLIEKLCN